MSTPDPTASGSSAPAPGRDAREGSAAESFANLRYAWLPAALPAAARRLRVLDPGLASVLADAGAELVEDEPDGEIGRAARLSGDAGFALVSVDLERPERWPRAARVAWTAAASLRVRIEAARARRALERLGYRTVDVHLWDWLQGWRAPETTGFGPQAIARRLPLNALVRGWRSAREPSLLDALVAEAETALGGPFDPGAPLFRRGLVVVLGREGVLRAAVGPARARIEEQQSALAALEAASPGPAVHDRVPWVRGGGKVGLADWSLESRLRGAVPAGELDPGLLDECLEFLVALHRAGHGAPPQSSPAADAEVVASASNPEDAPAVRELGSDLEERLAGIPRGFAHGDFWAGNLLVEGGRLAGVVDWDFAGPGRLPLLDLLGLRLGAVRVGRRLSFGRALVAHLLPWARSGGDERTRAYCDAVGAPQAAGRLEDFVAALWLDTLARDLRTYADIGRRRSWAVENVRLVLSALVGRAPA